MKKSLLFSIAVIGFYGFSWAQSSVKSQEFYGCAASCISDNGKWMVSEMDVQNSIRITNLETGVSYNYTFGGGDFDAGYDIANTRSVSNDGIVVGEVGNIPSYWKDGKWTELKGAVMNSAGNVFATVGAITPDGSMIVGSLGDGKGTGNEVNEEIPQLTFPCIWYRQDDGTYSEPEFVQNVDIDITGRTPLYLNLVAVSADGNTIGASLLGSKYDAYPYVYTRDEDGKWQPTLLAEKLVNPKGIVFPPYPGEFNEAAPNYEEYMSSAETAAMEDAYPAWYEEQEKKGLTDEDIQWLFFVWVANFMSGDNKTEYEAIANPWYEKFSKWLTDFDNYVKVEEQFYASGWIFEYNNIFLSPDGKYLYSSAKAGSSDNYTPIRLDVATDESTIYVNTQNILISYVTEDYSILGSSYSPDTDLYRDAYIFPQGDTTPVNIVEYFESQENKAVYNWMEDHMYQSVATGLTASGAEIFDDRWVVGIPHATPDMSLMSFTSSMLYWETKPAGANNANFITFLINTEMDEAEAPEENGVDDILVDSEGTPEFYNLQGARVYNPERGIYVKVLNGKATKVIL